jgi:hypothetical protein
MDRLSTTYAYNPIKECINLVNTIACFWISSGALQSTMMILGGRKDQRRGYRDRNGLEKKERGRDRRKRKEEEEEKYCH